jgi:hypothetical protein
LGWLVRQTRHAGLPRLLRLRLRRRRKIGLRLSPCATNRKQKKEHRVPADAKGHFAA